MKALRVFLGLLLALLTTSFIPISPVYASPGTVTLRPTDAGDLTEIPTQFPASDAHWDKVDEVSKDDDTTYLVNDAAYVYPYPADLYTLENLPAGVAAISNVRVCAYTRREGAGDNFAVLILKTGGTQYTSGLKSHLSTYTLITNDWATNPLTGVAWTVADINSLQAGVGLGRASPDPSYARCTQLYVIVTYTQSAPTVSTISVTSIGKDSAILTGNITDLGGIEGVTIGFQWGLATGNYSSNWTESGIFDGLFSHQIEGLTEGTTYYFRALATNYKGTSYGGELSFTTQALVLHITWQYGEVFLDQSGNGNTAFPSFRITSSNDTLSANITQQKCLTEAESPSANITTSGWTMITDIPPEPEGMYAEGGTSFPGGAEIQTLSDRLRLPVEVFTFPLAIGTSFLGGIAVFAGTRKTKAGANGSMFLAVIVTLVIYVFWTIAGGGVVPAWPIAIFVLAAILLFLWRKPYENPLS